MRRFFWLGAVSALATIAAAALWAGPPSSSPISPFDPAQAKRFTVGAGPGDLALGDVNRDGRADILTANGGGNSVSVLLGDGRGNFSDAPGSPFDAGPHPHMIALGDVNRDGQADLAVTEHDSHDVRVFLGRGDGTFRAAPGSPFAALREGRPHNHGLVIADVNADANPDLLTSNQNDSSVSVLLGDGQGGFRPAPDSPFRVGRDPYPLAVTEVNGDGKPDVVTPNVRADSVSVLLGDGQGGFSDAPGSPLRVAFRPYFVAAGDLNGDGKTDLSVAHDDITLISILLGDGHGGFRQAPGSPLDAKHRGSKMAIGDINRDTHADIAIAAGGFALVLLGDGTGRFTHAPGSPFALSASSWAVALRDVNADGRLDLLLASWEGNHVTLLLGR